MEFIVNHRNTLNQFLEMYNQQPNPFIKQSKNVYKNWYILYFTDYTQFVFIYKIYIGAVIKRLNILYIIVYIIMCMVSRNE